METLVGESLKERRFTLTVLGSFALAALLLAAVGTYGVVSYTVSRRTREMGIRLSLGADAGEVVKMVLKGALALVTVGGVIGLILTFGLAQALSRFLFGTSPHDPVTFIGVPLILGAVAILAAWIPARRASRIDPVRALRSE